MRIVAKKTFQFKALFSPVNFGQKKYKVKPLTFSNIFYSSSAKVGS